MVKEYTKNIYLLSSLTGVLPFLVLLIGCIVFVNDNEKLNIFVNMQFSYSCMIISFLSATYWQQAVYNKSTLQVLFCLIPLMFLIPVLFLNFYYSNSIALLTTVLFYWFMLVVDKYFGRESLWFRGYLLYRIILTFVVSFIILATYWVTAWA